MSRDATEELEARLEELLPAVEEFEFLQTTSYLLDEGFLTMDEDGGLHIAKEAIHLCP